MIDGNLKHSRKEFELIENNDGIWHSKDVGTHGKQWRRETKGLPYVTTHNMNHLRLLRRELS